jgi:hypothetical protein
MKKKAIENLKFKHSVVTQSIVSYGDICEAYPLPSRRLHEFDVAIGVEIEEKYWDLDEEILHLHILYQGDTYKYKIPFKMAWDVMFDAHEHQPNYDNINQVINFDDYDNQTANTMTVSEWLEEFDSTFDYREFYKCAYLAGNINEYLV